MRARYFASLRERIGKDEEDLDLPPELATVGDVIGWLGGRGDNYARALANAATVRAALDRHHAKHDAPIAGASEIALFPPMTGG